MFKTFFRLIFIVLFIISCQVEIPSQFSKKSLEDTLISSDSKELSFQEIINLYKGKKVLVDVWASWCVDCIKGMPKVVALQKSNPEVVFLFLSLDKNIEEWKAGIEKYNVNGEHYFLKSGWKGSLGSFLRLDWIPRYLVIDENGKIALFDAVKADDSRILEILTKKTKQ